MVFKFLLFFVFGNGLDRKIFLVLNFWRVSLVCIDFIEKYEL